MRGLPATGGLRPQHAQPTVGQTVQRGPQPADRGQPGHRALPRLRGLVGIRRGQDLSAAGSFETTFMKFVLCRVINKFLA